MNAFAALALLAVHAAAAAPSGPVPVIFETDYGMFIDDVFAMGVLLNSGDLLDLKMVVTSASAPEGGPELAAQCAAKHLHASGRADVAVAAGTPYPAYEARVGACGTPGKLPNVLARAGMCADVDTPILADGAAAMAEMIMESGRTDWWYIAVSGQSTLKDFVERFPGAAMRVDTLVVMGGSWCAGIEPYPGARAPLAETNIACDPAAANYVLDAARSTMSNVVYVPLVVADTIAGPEYAKFVAAAKSGVSPGAAATLEFYKAWSAAGRADDTIQIHAEATAYDPETESTPQFDACAVMVALELLGGAGYENRVALYQFEKGVRFGGAVGPAAAFSLQGGEAFNELPAQCLQLTNHTFDPKATPEYERAVRVALGYTSPAAKTQFFAAMAGRLAGPAHGGGCADCG